MLVRRAPDASSFTRIARMFSQRMFWSACVVLSLVTAGTAADSSPVLGRKLSELALKDHRGREWTLQDFADKPVLVVVFTGTECPLVQLYASRLQKLSTELADQGVAVISLNSNQQDNLTEIGAQVRTLGLTFPILKDLQNKVADQLGARRTPEAFVLDHNRVVRYYGRIDDQYSVGGKQRTAPTREDLKEAVREILAGKPVSIAETETVGCLIGKVRQPQTDAAVTYSNQISRLLQTHCVDCHRPHEIGPFSLTDYDEVAGWADMILEVTEQRRMPPWHASPEHGKFANARVLSQDELQLLRDWVDSGAPEGDRSQLPAPKTYTEGWQLPREPDLVIPMAKTPFKVPAEGEVRYQHFSVETGFTEDKWVQAMEIVPGNRAIVHHTIVFAAAAGERFNGERGFLAAYVPGLRPMPYPDGMAKRIPAGAKLVFQMHYTPNGTAEEDITSIGLIFADPAKVMQEVTTISVGSNRFKIKPQEDNQQFSSNVLTAPTDLRLLSLSPHMHLRGKSFRYEMTWPDGRKETLLDVPNYDFNWQTAYALADELVIPRGAKIQGFAAFDNSPNNLANPDPTATVVWGDQSWEEMLLGYFDVAVPRSESSAAELGKLSQRVRNDKPEDVAKELFGRFDLNDNGTIERDELPERQRVFFDQLDADKSASVSLEELTNGLKALRAATKPRQ